MRRPFRPRRSGRGFALMAILSLLIAGVLYFLVNWAGPDILNAYRAQKTEAALAQAREALLGFATTYRDAHPGELFGYLPCPDTDNDGVAELICGNKDVTVVGRLPWKTLGLPDIRDGYGECLWYVVSGHFKYNPKTDAFNWDTTSRISFRSADGQPIAALPGDHDSPIAVIIAPGRPLQAQDRAPLGNTICGGNTTAGAYLEGNVISAAAETEGDNSTDSVVTIATPASIENGTNNDRGAAITSRDIFGQILKRSDFKNDVDVLLLKHLEDCLNGHPLPDQSPGNKGIDSVLDPGECGAPAAAFTGRIQSNWKDNLLYAKAVAGNISVNGETDCEGVLAFSGSREPATLRRIAAERSLVANYLSAANAALFPDGVVGGTVFDALQPTQDLFRCLRSTGPITITFDNDIGRFAFPAGDGASREFESIPEHPSLDIVSNGAMQGGCLWYPDAVPLEGRNWRVFFRSQFAQADPFSRFGYGSTFQIVASDPGTAPNDCGSIENMGALGTGSQWGQHSFILETDIAQNAVGDASGNHIAFMFNGDLRHTTSVGTACNGTQSACAPAPADKFEESPTPTAHSHRIEIHTGCSPSCNTCSAGSPGTHVRIRAWLDCDASPGCSDVAADFPSSPHIRSCVSLESAAGDWSQVFFGFTGGFGLVDGVSQGVTIWDFNLRAE